MGTERYSFTLLMVLILCLLSASGCSKPQPKEQIIQGYALGFADLGTLHMSRLDLNYSADNPTLAGTVFEIGVYQNGNRIASSNMKHGDRFSKDLEPGTYQVKVENPENYFFAYLPGETFQLQDGIGQVYAMVVNSKNSTDVSLPVKWEVYYTEAGSPAGNTPLTGGEIPALKPGEMFTLRYNPEGNPNSKAGNYMFRLINPASDVNQKECWSGAVYCIGPIKPTNVFVNLLPNPGKITVGIKTTGAAPASAVYEFVIHDVVNSREAARHSLSGGGRVTVSLPPGTYAVAETQSGGALSYSKSIDGNIALASGQNVYVTFNNRFPEPVKGFMQITMNVEGAAPQGAAYEVSISGPSGSIKRSIYAGQTITVELPQGYYEVIETNSGGAAQVRRNPPGSIPVYSGQYSAVSITNVYTP